MTADEYELIRLMNPELLKFDADIASIPSQSERIEYFRKMMAEMYLEGLGFGWSYANRKNSNFSSSAIMRLLEVNAQIRVPGEKIEHKKGGRKPRGNLHDKENS